MLKYMYITNNPEIAEIAELSGVERIWIDLEKNGKYERQKNMDSVKSNHSISDIGKVKSVLKKAEVIVRVNPLFRNSGEEIDKVVSEGADLIMLPMFKTIEEIKEFIGFVNGRAKTVLLLETKEAAQIVEDICNIKGIDEIHIGLNDLHLSYGNAFMFELLANGEVEKLCHILKNSGIPYGFGGIARLNEGTLPARHILAEHYRLGSTRAILSRSFCNYEVINDMKTVEQIFSSGMKELRDYEDYLTTVGSEYLENNKMTVKREVAGIVKSIQAKRAML